ncbi:hypothetical protein LINGRAHAP2_LOCUS30549 [Linum grandiflorum]
MDHRKDSATGLRVKALQSYIRVQHGSYMQLCVRSKFFIIQIFHLD